MMRPVLILLLALLLLAGAAAGTAWWLLEDRPRVTGVPAPSAGDVARTRAVFRRLKVVAAAGTPTAFEMSLADVNSALRVVTRVVPGLKAEAQTTGQTLEVRASLPLPLPRSLSGPGYLNLEARAQTGPQGAELAAVRLGGRPVPPRLVAWLGATALRLGMRGDTGAQILDNAGRMRVQGETLHFVMALDAAALYGTYSDTFSVMRRSEMPGPEEINRHYVRLRRAMDAGTLPDEGSLLPYIRFALEAALHDARLGTHADEYTAAIFALARACGANAFRLIVGPLAGIDPWSPGTWEKSCARIRLNGRGDTRLHFITAAAIQAASNRGVSVSVGEFKELYDTISGSGGFDFTDIAANNSGIRMSDRFMGAAHADWPGLIDRIRDESDIIIAFDGVPGLLDPASFDAQFGDIESPAYYAMLEQIEARIDALALHAD